MFTDSKADDIIDEQKGTSWVKSASQRKSLERMYTFNKDLGEERAVVTDEDLLNIITEGNNLKSANISQNEEVNKKGMEILKENIDKVVPLYLLGKDQKEKLLSEVKFVLLNCKQIIYGEGVKEDSNAVYILLEGNVLFFGKNRYFLDGLTPINLFGYDGAIFGHRFNTVVGKKNALLAIIPSNTFLDIVVPFSNFAIYLERTILLKDKVFEPLDKFKQYILSSINESFLNLDVAIELYSKTEPCLHPKLNMNEIDFMAWTYALNRLPSNIFETYYYTLQNKPPFLLRVNSDNSTDITLIPNKARPRDVFAMNGKSLVLLRDMETDTLDFVANLCIFLVETKKIRKELLNPKIVNGILAEIQEKKSTFESTCTLIEKFAKLNITKEEKDALKAYFKDDFGKKLIENIWNHGTISVSIQKKVAINKLSIEAWSENVMADLKKGLGTEKPITEIDDLVVDISQGSKTTLLAIISPFLYKYKEEILKWGKENNIQLKTKVFLNENDKLIAYSYYYYKAFPEKQKESDKMLEENGIYMDWNTFGTGVALLVVNVNKLNPKYLDPSLHFKAASKNHIILHLGYTFGNQSREIINPVLMMLGKKARSLNIIGKAGGLTGKRTDILAASRIFSDKKGDMVNLNMGEFNAEEFKKAVNTDVHVGPILCVAGTILQNYDLLNYYKKINGCVGLEMEGFYFADEVAKGIEHGLLRKDFVSRFFYYVSDLPLVIGETLSAEGGNVCWEEGVGSMNAIQRHVLNCIFS
ncbi:MAG: hypothetical protein MJ252_24075 [archaeon]|nr:hypothetical protein [archaeon]